MDTGRHAIVIGASMAGLTAARALATGFERVTVVERDELPAVGEQRLRVPQGRHLHLLIPRGLLTLEELFPGIGAELVAHGAIDIRTDQMRMYFGGHRLATAPGGPPGIGMSRPLLEGVVRERVRALPQVEFRTRAEVVGLLSEGDRVTGVRLRDGELAADLVVDAGGRSSRAPGWLRELGFPVPDEEEVRVDLGYATRTYRRRPGDLGGAIMVQTDLTPELPRGGLIHAVEGDRWLITVSGMGDDRPAHDGPGFDAFVASLPWTEVNELMATCEPLTDPVPYRFTSSVRRRYDRLTRFPTGYLVVGDALCSFNPVYGQGMTIATMEAAALRDCLGYGLDALSHRFFRRAAKIIDTPWDIVIGGDMRFPHIEGPRTVKTLVGNVYLGMVLRAARRDPVVTDAFLRVLALIDPPSSLTRPALAWRVAGRQTGAPEAVTTR
jgi:2-polyprenyl-6-methoxyphenol hydroxylase-like FAD-dependent oxidoreductase